MKTEKSRYWESNSSQPIWRSGCSLSLSLSQLIMLCISALYASYLCNDDDDDEPRERMMSRHYHPGAITPRLILSSLSILSQLSHSLSSLSIL